MVPRAINKRLNDPSEFILVDCRVIANSYTYFNFSGSLLHLAQEWFVAVIKDLDIFQLYLLMMLMLLLFILVFTGCRDIHWCILLVWGLCPIWIRCEVHLDGNKGFKTVLDAILMDIIPLGVIANIFIDFDNTSLNDSILAFFSLCSVWTESSWYLLLVRSLTINQDWNLYNNKYKTVRLKSVNV